jgi:hypothetical protein
MAAAEQIRPHPQIVFSRVSDAEGILLSLVSKRYYSLNESGMALWTALESGAGPGGMAAAIEAEYEVSGGEAEALVTEFLALLAEEGLVRTESAGPR